MSSYKGHSLFALILAILFFHNPLTISLAIIGANIPDFDHDVKKENVYWLIILGLVVFIVLYFLKLPYYIGLILVYFGITFYFSEHRSFTHSIFACIIFSVLLAFILKTSYSLFPQTYCYLILIVLLACIFLNRKLLVVFLGLLFLSLFIFDLTVLTDLEIFTSLFLGLISHIVLDSFTPAGVKLFAPLSKKTVNRKFGIVACVLIVLLGVLHFIFYFFPQFFNKLFIFF